jgi:hypothetical protein
MKITNWHGYRAVVAGKLNELQVGQINICGVPQHHQGYPTELVKANISVCRTIEQQHSLIACKNWGKRLLEYHNPIDSGDSWKSYLEQLYSPCEYIGADVEFYPPDIWTEEDEVWLKSRFGTISPVICQQYVNNEFRCMQTADFLRQLWLVSASRYPNLKGIILYSGYPRMLYGDARQPIEQQYSCDWTRIRAWCWWRGRPIPMWAQMAWWDRELPDSVFTKIPRDLPVLHNVALGPDQWGDEKYLGDVIRNRYLACVSHNSAGLGTVHARSGAAKWTTDDTRLMEMMGKILKAYDEA